MQCKVRPCVRVLSSFLYIFIPPLAASSKGEKKKKEKRKRKEERGRRKEGVPSL
jgi:hypothetical protein